MRAIAVALGLAAIACVYAPAAGARGVKQHWFRISHYTLKATATQSGSVTDEDGSTLSGSATRSGDIDYRGRRDDIAVFNDQRHGYLGKIETAHTVEMPVNETGSWTRTDRDGSQSGSCRGEAAAPYGLFSDIKRAGGSLQGRIDGPFADAELEDNCPLEPGLGTPMFFWKLPVSAFRKRVVKIPLRYDLEDGDGFHDSVHWSGTVTLRLLKVCRTSRCAASVR